jgi:hypothetical protein
LTYDGTGLGFGDIIVGIQNRSGSTLWSFDVAYPNQPFTLDKDGACILKVPGFSGPGITCSSDGAEGPGVYFTNLGEPAGTVNFTGGLPNGDEAFFAVDDDLNVLFQVSNIITTPTAPIVATPEPMSLSVFGAVLAGFGLMRNRRWSQAPC